ncbi:MAG: hypothetical protein WCO12_00025 [bacterium]
MTYKNKNNQGFIGIIVLIVVAIVILSYLGFDLRKIFTSDMVQKNFSYVFGFIKNIWSNYLSVPFTFIWNEVVHPIFSLMWKAFLAGVEGIKSSNATTQ